MAESKPQSARPAPEDYYFLLEYCPDGILLLGPDRRILEANSRACEFTGYTREELLGRSGLNIFSSEVLTREPTRFDLLDQGQVISREREFLRRDGSRLPLEMKSMRLPDGRYLSFFHDITARRQRERAMRASDARHVALISAIPDILFQNARDGTYLACHAGDPAQLLLPPEALLGKKWEEVLPPVLATSVTQTTEKTFATGELQYLEYELPLADGSHCFEARIAPGPSETSFTVVRDITQRKRAEQELQESERRLSTLMGNLPGMAYRCRSDRDWTMEFVSEGCLELTGYVPEDLLKNRRITFAELIDPAHRGRVWKTWQSRLAMHKSVQMEYPIITASGKVKWVWEQGCGIFSPSGELEALEGFITDISKRKRSEDRIRESERRYQELFLNTPDSVFWVRQEKDGGFILESANPAQVALLGIAASALAGRRLEDILPPDLAETLSTRYRGCLGQGRSISYEESYPMGGPPRWFQTLLVPLRDAGGKMCRLVGFSRDITQKKNAEEALLQAQKLESLGVLAGGIAHDFNNLLTAVLGNVNLAQMQLSPESPAQPYLANMEKTVLKASELTKQMLAYSGKGRFVVKLHDLNHLVQGMTHLLQVSISKRITLRYELEPMLPALEADAAQIQQVVMNLVTNASDAIGDTDGSIGIRTGFLRLDEAYIASTFPNQTLNPGPYVFLEVSDSGCGMSPEIQGRIFDPFFSTKAVGRGLGLSAMLGILRGHHAGIKIYSEPGRGTTFQLFFPASETPLAQDAGPQPERETLLQGLVLVVDDEPVILETAAAALRHMGFTVLSARDGVEGLEIFRAHSSEIRLVLLDLTMPRMDGRETFQALRQIRPDLPVILSSGYNEQESAQGFLGQGLAGFIQKPYSLKELRAVITAVLSKASAG